MPPKSKPTSKSSTEGKPKLPTRRQVKRALNIYEESLGQYKNVVGLGIVNQEKDGEGASVSSPAVAIYVRKDVSENDASFEQVLPKHLEIKIKGGVLQVPTTIIEQSDVSLESAATMGSLGKEPPSTLGKEEPAFSKITYTEYFDLARNPDTDDELLLSYSIVERGTGGFNFIVRPDPEKVQLSEDDIELENRMQIGNALYRGVRQVNFNKQRLLGTDLPVLVSEGDSWFQFPLLVHEVIDQLQDSYLIWSLGAAGDTAQNMVASGEYLRALLSKQDEVQGFLFSAAGNDIIGQDPITQRPVLFDMLKNFNGNKDDIEGHIHLDILEQKLAFLKNAYTTVISKIHAQPKLKELPIFIHGYDYVFPYPWGDDDPRDPGHAYKNEWLGKPLNQREIMDKLQRRRIIQFMIDSLYEMLSELSGDPVETNVWLVDCRGSMPDVGDWIDEIHGTSEGFKKVATRFRAVMEQAL